MKNKKIVISISAMLFIIVAFSIGSFIYNHVYKIDIARFSYVFNSRIVESPDKEHAVSVTIYKTSEDSDIAYIMGTLGSSDGNSGYTKDSKTIFWQKVNSDSIQDKTINDVLLTNWIDVHWLDSQTIEINGVTFNISKGHDFRRN